MFSNLFERRSDEKYDGQNTRDLGQKAIKRSGSALNYTTMTDSVFNLVFYLSIAHSQYLCSSVFLRDHHYERHHNFEYMFVFLFVCRIHMLNCS